MSSTLSAPLRRTLVLAIATLLGADLTAQARPTGRPAANAATPATRRFDFSKDKSGAEPTQFLNMVGNWIVTEDSGRKVLLVDGREWKQGQPAGSLANKARALYGARHEEFIDNVKAFAYYPIVVNKEIDRFTDGALSVRFKMVGGDLDRCGGILFNVKPNGDYLTIRFNGTEDNLGMWKVVKGVRTLVWRSPEVTPIAMRTWAEITVVVDGKRVRGSLNGRQLIDFEWTEPIDGKVGLWSKTDSMTEFDAFTVTPKVAAK
jgi:hypothetical protein